MPDQEAVLQTVTWKGGKVRLIDQTALPERLTYIELSDWREVVEAIRTMVVRGAPAIGCTAALGMAVAARQIEETEPGAFLRVLDGAAEEFRASRPTAVNLFWAVDRILRLAHSNGGSVEDIRAAVVREAVRMLEEDVVTNRALGRNGAELLKSGDTVLTHCNAGALCAVG